MRQIPVLKPRTLDEQWRELRKANRRLIKSLTSSSDDQSKQQD
jgi:uncharacterized damage-inducible protein DinB